MAPRRRIIKKPGTEEGAEGLPLTSRCQTKKMTGKDRLSQKKLKQDIFIDAYLGNDFSVTEAAAQAGVSRRLFYWWKANDADFVARFEDAVEARKDYVQSALFRLIKQGNVAACIFWLKCKARDRGFADDKSLAPIFNQTIEIHRDKAHIDRMVEASKMELDFDKLNLPPGHREALEKSERARRAELGYK